MTLFYVDGLSVPDLTMYNVFACSVMLFSYGHCLFHFQEYVPSSSIWTNFTLMILGRHRSLQPHMDIIDLLESSELHCALQVIKPLVRAIEGSKPEAWIQVWQDRDFVSN